MEKLYFMVTNDEFELPIAVGSSVKELARETGRSENSIRCKMRSQRLNKKSISYKIEVVEVEDESKRLN